jgi:hypothetical protein
LYKQYKCDILSYSGNLVCLQNALQNHGLPAMEAVYVDTPNFWDAPANFKVDHSTQGAAQN